MIPLLQLKYPVESASSDGIKKAPEPERITAAEVKIIEEDETTTMYKEIAQQGGILEPQKDAVSASQDQRQVSIHEVCNSFMKCFILVDQGLSSTMPSKASCKVCFHKVEESI